MHQDQYTFKRAMSVALLGLSTQVVLTVTVALIGVFAESRAVMAAFFHLLGGLPIWIILAMIYNQHRLERQEALEAESLARSDAQAAALFNEAGQQLALAKRRLEHLYKYGYSLVGIGLATYLLTVGGSLLFANWKAYQAGVLQKDPFVGTNHLGLVAFILIGVAFIAFLVARYLAGMTDVSQWRDLRSGASYLMGNMFVAVLLVVATVFGHFEDLRGFVFLALLIPAMMVVLGVEVLLSFVFGIYRPRRKGENVRPAFDSRILGWLTRPESMGKIVSETLNYQFGFEITKSWFYQFLARWVGLFVLVCFALVIGASGFVFVEPHQKAVVTHFGGNPRVVGPGVSFKWPWPVGGVQRFDVYRVHSVTVGSDLEYRDNVAILWTTVHTEGEEVFLITAPSRDLAELEYATDIAAGELAGTDVTLKYRIDEDRLLDYATSVADPNALLRALTEREVNRYFATHDIDTLLTSGRMNAGDYLLERIRAEVALQHLGLEVVSVSMVGIHPPQNADVALSFHQQIGALQEKESQIQDALRMAINTLAGVAGSADRARQISDAIAELNTLRERLDQAEDDQLQRQLLQQQADIEQAVDQAGGEAARIILTARAYRWGRSIGELAKTERFASQLLAYRQAPEYYKARLYLDTLSEALQGRRKIIIDSESSTDPIIRLQLEDHAGALGSLFDGR